jgi:hypothetical protein
MNMPKAYWVICHRSTKSAEKFAALHALADGAERDLRIVEGV